MKRTLLALTCLVITILTGFSAGQASAGEQFTSVNARAIAPIRPVLATDGKKHLAYELVLTNYAGTAAAIERINRFAGKRPLPPITGASILKMLKPFGPDPGTNVLQPGQSGLILMDISFRPRAKLPARISHQFVVATENEPLTYATKYRTGTVRVLDRPTIQIRPPLRGPGWVAANGCCDEFTSHRAAVLPVNGALYNSERYAIDFMQVQPDGMLLTGSWEDLTSYPFFGDPIVSATSGKVVRVMKDQPETQPSGILKPPNARTVGGNYVVVKRARGQYAFYAHMQPNSARVRVGQRVRAGQVLGTLGSSGNSNAPHLHFHMMDRPDPVAANGIPYTFSRFGIEGRLTNFNDLFDGVPAQIDPRFTGMHSRQLPLNLQVVDFPNR